MKLTDFSIMFLIIVVPFFVISIYNINLAAEENHNKMIVSNIMDTAITDSLETAYEGVDNNGKPIIDKEKALKQFEIEMAIGLTGNKRTLMLENIKNNIVILIVCDMDGFWIYGKKDKWKTKEDYIGKNHSEKVAQLNASVNKVLKKEGLEMYLCTNDGESWCQSLSDYSIYAVYREDKKRYVRSEKDIYFFSGAAIKKK